MTDRTVRVSNAKWRNRADYRTEAIFRKSKNVWVTSQGNYRCAESSVDVLPTIGPLGCDSQTLQRFLSCGRARRHVAYPSLPLALRRAEDDPCRFPQSHLRYESMS